NIAVVIGSGNGLGVIVKQPWAKRTDDIVLTLKGQMDRRRLVDSSGYRFEIMNAEDVRIATSVPSDRVKRMVVVMDPVHLSLLFRADKKVSFPVEGFQVFGYAYV